MAGMTSPYVLMGRKVAQNAFDGSMVPDMGMEPSMQDPQAFQNQQQILEQATPKMALTPEMPAQPPQPQQEQIPQVPLQGGMAPMSREDIINQLRLATEEDVKSQREGLKFAEQRLKEALEAPKEIDWSPLIALADQWSGSDLLSAYQRPQSKEKQIQALQEMVLKSRGQLSETQRRSLQDVLESEDRKLSREATRAATEQARAAADVSRAQGLQLKQNAETRASSKQYNDEFGQTIRGATEVANAAQKIKDIINRNGGMIPTDITGEGKLLKEEYDSAVSSMITGFNRDIAKLGALAGADLNIINKAINADTSLFNAYIKNWLGSGGRGTIKTIDDFLKRNDDLVSQARRLVIKGNKEALPIFEEDEKFYLKTRSGSKEQVKDGSKEKPKTINQGGVVYTLNPQTGEYE